jgi:hypothetical protein
MTELKDLGVQIVPGQEQFVLYHVQFTKFDEWRYVNLFLPTLEMAEAVHRYLSFFMKNWKVGRYRIQNIERMLFTKVNDRELLGASGATISIPYFKHMCDELMEHPPHTTLPQGMYDEFMLAVLCFAGYPPRIKRKGFTLNPLASDYIVTDELTIRRKGLVVPSVP